MDDHSMADSSQDSPVNRQFDAGGDNAAVSTSSTTPPPPPPPQDRRAEKVRFIKSVHDTLNNPSKFKNFLDVMFDFSHNRISEAELCKRVKEKLKDYPFLLPGLSSFLPPTPTGQTQEEAHRFMEIVKIRFQNKKENYQAFLKLLIDFGRSEISRVEAIQGVFNLFDGYEDLMREFKNFLQSDDSNNR